MCYKKIILLCLLPIFLYASEKKVDTKELLDYSSLPIKKGLSVYAAKVHMHNFEDDNAYSIGLLHQSKNSNTEVGVGYMQPVDQIGVLFGPAIFNSLYLKDEGALLFMKYHF